MGGFLQRRLSNIKYSFAFQARQDVLEYSSDSRTFDVLELPTFVFIINFQDAKNSS